MAQTGFTPIQLYSSSTATNVPLAANLANGELAINITDGKLFYKDNAAAVQVIGWKTVPATAGGTGQTSYAVGDLLYADTTTTLAKLPDVATGNALISGGVGVAPSWGKIGLTTHVSGTLPVANGGTNLTSFTSGGVVYASSTSALATGSALVFNGTSLLIGTTTTTKNTRLSQNLAVVTVGSGNFGGESITSYCGTSPGIRSIFDINRSRGTTDGSMTAVVSGDFLGSLLFRGADGTDFQDAAMVQGEVDGAVATGSVAGRLTFSTAPAGGGVIERARIPSTGGFQSATSISVGNAVPTTSGAGITFPATQSASSDANTLDDYEEGTWTATLTGSITAPTVPVTAAAAVYTKIGRSVELNFNFDNVSVAGATGDALITGVPFACGSTAGHGVVGVGAFGASVLCASIFNAATQINLRNSTTTVFAPITSGTVGIYILCQLTYSA